MAMVIWDAREFGVHVEEDDEGRFWIRTSDDTPPVFRKAPYVCEGHFTHREGTIAEAKILVDHCRLGNGLKLKYSNA